MAEAGLPCSHICKVFHLPSPSCTSDNLQYYFFCLTEFVSIAVWTFPPLCCVCFVGFLFFFPPPSPGLMCSYPYPLSQSPSFCCKGISFCGLSVSVVKFSWWLRSLRNRWAIVHLFSNLLWILCGWCWCLEMMHILQSMSPFYLVEMMQMHWLVGSPS